MRHLVLSKLEIQIPVILAARIECAPTLDTFAPTFHVLVNCQDMFALPTQDCFCIPAVARPCPRFVIFASIMAANASVEFVTTEMLDGNNVERGMPVQALRAISDGHAVDYKCRRAGWLHVGHVVRSDVRDVGRRMHDDVEMGPV